MRHANRTILVLAVAGLLAACTAPGDGANNASVAASPGAASASGAASGAAVGEPSPACAEAFAPMAEMELESTSDLGELAEVEATVESCESVADWMAGAQQVVENEVRPGAAELLLRIRCESGSLSSTPICEELG